MHIAKNKSGSGFQIAGSSDSFSGKKSTARSPRAMMAWDSKCSETGNHFSTSSTSANGDKQWVVGPGQVDEGGNKSSGSLFSVPPNGGESAN